MDDPGYWIEALRSCFGRGLSGVGLAFLRLEEAYFHLKSEDDFLLVAQHASETMGMDRDMMISRAIGRFADEMGLYEEPGQVLRGCRAPG